MSRRLEVRGSVHLIALAACLAAAGCASAPPAPSSVPLHSPVAPLPGAVGTVVIDAGHGGHDPGASHFGLQEKHLALDIAKRLAARLEEAGLTVVMTRETDRFIPLSRRATIANRAQADLFVSIHLNANPRGRVSGIEVYYPRGSVVSSAAEWPPSVSPSEVGIPTTAVKQVLWDLVLRETRAQSRLLASAVCRALEHDLGSPCRTVKPARFVVLREAWMPSVLVEAGYLSNRVALHLRLPAQSLPTVTARVTGTGLVWEAEPWRIVGDLMVNGTASPPSRPDSHWALNGVATLKRATMEGLPLAGTITELEGAARLSPDRIEIERLTGTMLGSPWTVEGAVTLEPLALEALVTSRVQLAPMASALPPLAAWWRPDGAADLRAVCRGPLAPSPILDCLAEGEFEGAALAPAALTDPLTGIAGRVAYESLARRITIERLAGRLRGQPFAVAGRIRLAKPLELALHLDGALPLDAATPWLSAKMPGSELGGLASVDLELDGSSAAARLSGDVELHEVVVRLAAPALRIERLTGSARFGPWRIEIPKATLRLNDAPLTLRAEIMPPAEGLGLAPLSLSRLNAGVDFPQGRLQLSARLTPQDFLIDGARVELAETRLELRGAVARTSDHPSALDLSGAVKWEELQDLPLVSWPGLEAWGLAGAAEVEAQFEGQLSDWPSATIQSRVRSRAMQVRHLPLEQLLCTAEQRNGVLRVRIPSGLLAGGKLTGELTVDHRPDAQGDVLETDLIGMDLAALSQAIPAWRSKPLAGRASAHALLAGRRKARATWRGEGWLNASGERLGNLPLLEKVFRGLFGVLAERMGLETLQRAQITEASVRWRLAEERLTTDDLRLGGAAGIEPIAIYAKGSVGLDQTLDFVIEPELSEVALLQAPTTASLAGTVLKAAGQLERLRRLIGRHRLTGTLKDPVYRFEFTTQDVLRQLAPAPVDLLRNIFDAAR